MLTENVQSKTECLILCRALFGIEADQYIVDSYQRALALRNNPPTNGFDRLLCRLILLGPWIIGFLDSYSRYLFPHSVFRYRIIVLMAIVENAKAGLQHIHFHKASRSFIFAMILCAYYVAKFFASLIISMIFLSPIHFGYKLLSALRAQPTHG